jgi:hypothetical protein
LLESVSFPDIKRALTPTVTAALVDAVSAFWRIKNPTLTHKPFSINDKSRLGFQPFHTVTE